MGKTVYDLNNKKKQIFMFSNIYSILKSKNTFPPVAGFKNVKNISSQHFWRSGNNLKSNIIMWNFGIMVLQQFGTT